MLKVYFAVVLSMPAGEPPPAESPPDPSVAVMTLAAKQGVSADLAELLTDNLVASLRRTGRFSRVVAGADIAAALAFESQKQLLQCDTAGCIAEIAGSLGVDTLIVGNIGKVGELWLFNVKLVDVKTGVARSAVSRPVEGTSESALVRAVDSIIAELLSMGVANAPPPRAPQPPAPPPVPTHEATTPQPPEPPPAVATGPAERTPPRPLADKAAARKSEPPAQAKTGSSMTPHILRGGALLAGLGGALALVVAVAGVVVAAVAAGVFTRIPGFDRQKTFFVATIAGGAIAGVVAGLASVVSVGIAAAVAGASMVVN